jgi:hypothetical protein
VPGSLLGMGKIMVIMTNLVFTLLSLYFNRETHKSKLACKQLPVIIKKYKEKRWQNIGDGRCILLPVVWSGTISLRINLGPKNWESAICTKEEEDKHIQMSWGGPRPVRGAKRCMEREKMTWIQTQEHTGEDHELQVPFSFFFYISISVGSSFYYLNPEEVMD